MSVFSQKYSPEQKQAVVDAVLDGVQGQPGSGPLGRGTPVLGRPMTAKEAQRAAAEGRLPDLPAFEMNLSTIRNNAQEARRDRDGKKPSRLDRKAPADASDEVFRRMLRMADATLRRAEVKAKSSKGLTLKELSDLAKISVDVDRAAKQRMTKHIASSSRGDATPEEAEEPKPSGLIAQLAAKAQGTGPSTQTSLDPESAEGEDKARSETAAKQPANTTPADTRETEPPVPLTADISFAPVRDDGIAAAQALLRAGRGG
jgi:hypothetical protein